MDPLARVFKGNLKRSPFAERVTFFPASGAQRELSALIETIASLPMDEAGTTEREELIVTVYNDPEDPDVGGIAAPVLGDSLQRHVGEIFYGYTGRIVSRTAYSWRLVFIGERLREVGPR